MDNVNTTTKKRLFKNDRMFVCSMLVFYSLCTIGLIAALFWGIDRRNKVVSANATATQSVIATQIAHTTATAEAHATQLAQYELVDIFDSNENDWRVGMQESDYWQGKIQISSGVYSWDVESVKKGFIAWADAPVIYQTGNYDTYVDVKFDRGTGKACGGFLFNVSISGWRAGGYTFYICRTGFYYIYFHKGTDWDEISSNYSSYILPNEWNRLELLVQDTHFTFLINSQVVFETDDDRQSAGDLALFINVDEVGTKILFDNFGFQSR